MDDKTKSQGYYIGNFYVLKNYSWMDFYPVVENVSNRKNFYFRNHLQHQHSKYDRMFGEKVGFQVRESSFAILDKSGANCLGEIPFEKIYSFGLNQPVCNILAVFENDQVVTESRVHVFYMKNLPYTIFHELEKSYYNYKKSLNSKKPVRIEEKVNGNSKVFVDEK